MTYMNHHFFCNILPNFILSCFSIFFYSLHYITTTCFTYYSVDLLLTCASLNKTLIFSYFYKTFPKVNNTIEVGNCQQHNISFLLKFFTQGILLKRSFNVDLSQAIRIRITNLIEERNLNVSKLSTMAGISRATLSKFLSGQRTYLRIDIIEYICEGLNIKLKDFFNDPIFDSIEMED